MRAIRLAALATSVLVSSTAGQIPRTEYLRNIPLQVPTLVRQTESSAEVRLFGDRSHPAYRDLSPVDGIDDRRREVFERLALRFAPYLVLNTPSVPMDVRRFLEGEEPFPLFVDRWDVSTSSPTLLRSEEVAWQALEEQPCEAGDSALPQPPPDCRLLALLDRYDPAKRSCARTASSVRRRATSTTRSRWADRSASTWASAS